jgi:hypothetical protein
MPGEMSYPLACMHCGAGISYEPRTGMVSGRIVWIKPFAAEAGIWGVACNAACEAAATAQVRARHEAARALRALER